MENPEILKSKLSDSKYIDYAIITAHFIAGGYTTHDICPFKGFSQFFLIMHNI